MKLYEITSQINEIANLDLPAESVAETIESFEMDFNEKANNIALVNANMSGDIASIDGQIKRLQSMKSAIVGRQDQLKEYLRYNMDKSGISKIQCPLFSISLRKPLKVVSIDDVESIPDEYVKVTTSVAPDKALIAKALKAGSLVTGATLVDGKSSLTIK